MGDSTKTSLYQYIVAHTPAERPGLLPGGDVLPDDPHRDDVLRFAPGLVDRILDPGTELSAEQTASSLVPPFVEAALGSARGESYVVLYRQLVAVEHLGFLEPFVRRVIASGLPRRRVRSVALRLDDRASPGVHQLRRYGITNAFGPRDDILWELAKVTTGWGRIAIVQQLALTQQPAIKAWILRETGRDHLLLMQACLVAAETGDLREELSADEIDDELCVAAGAILQMLIENRPYKMLIENRPYKARDSIDDYVDGRAAIELFLTHLQRRPEDLKLIQPLLTIIDYLELGGGVSWSWNPEYRERLVKEVAGRPLVGWTNDERTHAATAARWVLGRPGWRRAIEDGLRSSDEWMFYLAVRAAMRLGDDVSPVLLERLRRDPYASEITWHDAARTADEAGLDDLLEVALTRLSEHRPYQSEAFPRWLTAILDGLKRFPGKGWPLIREGLSSGVTMERRFGIDGMRTLGKPWPREAMGLLVALARSDPDEHNREMAAELLEEHGHPSRPSTP